MTEFNPSDIHVTIKDSGFKDEITKDGIAKRNDFTIEAKNNSNLTLSWLAVELVSTSEDIETTYDKVIMDGTSSTHKSKWAVTKLHKYKFIFNTPLDQGTTHEKNYWIKYNEGANLDGHIGLFVYQIYGELSNGENFLQRRHSHKIDFDANGRANYSIKKSFSSCVVTTAAFGDPQHTMVEAFRGLREQILVNFKLGRHFINWYNNIGPSLAKGIENRPQLRLVARGVLTPLARTIVAARKIIDASPRLSAYFYAEERE